METDFPEIEEEFQADAWCEVIFVRHSLSHKAIARMTAVFLASGGEISEIAMGKRTQQIRPFNGASGSAASAQEIEAEQGRRNSAAARVKDGDVEIIRRMNEQVETFEHRTQMMRSLHISNDRCMRLIETHFRDDPRFARMLSLKERAYAIARSERHEQPSAA